MKRLFAALLIGLWPGALAAQQVGGPLNEGVVQTPVLVIEFERVFAESAFGKQVIAQIEEEGSALSAENRQIEAELSEEERLLTEQRATLSQEDFRALASSFDEKVQRLRQQQDAKARAIGARPDEARRQFIATVQPIIQQIMQESRAVVILERRAVFASVGAIDVTDLAIARINAEIGVGEGITAPEQDR